MIAFIRNALFKLGRLKALTQTRHGENALDSKRHSPRRLSLARRKRFQRTRTYESDARKPVENCLVRLVLAEGAVSHHHFRRVRLRVVHLLNAVLERCCDRRYEARQINGNDHLLRSRFGAQKSAADRVTYGNVSLDSKRHRQPDRSISCQETKKKHIRKREGLWTMFSRLRNRIKISSFEQIESFCFERERGFPQREIDAISAPSPWQNPNEITSRTTRLQLPPFPK